MSGRRHRELETIYVEEYGTKHRSHLPTKVNRGQRQVRRPAGARAPYKADQLGVNIVSVYREDDGTSVSSATNHHRSLCRTELAQSSPFGH